MPAFFGFLALTVLAVLPGLRGANSVKRKVWYRSLRKSKLNPPDQVFRYVWPVLYGLSAYSAARVWKHRATPEGKTALALWVAQLAFNSAWTPLFFKAHRTRAAFVDLGLTAAMLSAYAKRAGQLDQSAAWAVAPYLAWLGFAAHLNGSVVMQNPKLLAG